jgi:hypothetical protein
MKHIYCLVLFVLLGSGLTSAQTRDLYTHPRFAEIAGEHELIAVLPFRTMLFLRPGEVAKVGGLRGVQDLERMESLKVQHDLQLYFQQLNTEHEVVFKVQDPSQTNTILQAHGIATTQIAGLSKKDLAQLLGVDAVVYGTYGSSHPMLHESVLAIGMSVGFQGPKHNSTMALFVNDGATGELLWRYEHTEARSIGPNADIISLIMRKAAKQFPYSRKFKG